MIPLAVIALHVLGQVAPTPPMGWNSYDCFSYAVNEPEVIANAEFMRDRLRRYGWEYVVVDYIWSAPRGSVSFAPDQNAKFEPRLAMDGNGRLLPDETRFPSAKGGRGFRGLADRLHGMGLKFGIHLMRGIPRQTVAERLPIAGSRFRADDAANVKSVCGWLNHMFGLNMANGAGQAYLDSIFRLYASWGVDFVKVDDLSMPYSSDEVAGYRHAIDRCGRKIVLSLSPGPTPLSAGPHVAAHAQMWRLLGDLWDNWGELAAAFRATADWSKYRRVGAWPDPDMLPLGRLRKYGPNTGPANTDSRLTIDEQRTMMTLWSVTQSPLMFGGHLPETTPATLELITNPEVLAVDQHGRNARRIAERPYDVFVCDGERSDEMVVAVFRRRGSAPERANVALTDFGVQRASIRDLWKRAEVGDANLGFDVSLPPHGVAMFKLRIKQRCAPTTPAPFEVAPVGDSYEAESSLNLLGGTAVSRVDPDHLCSGGRLVGFVGRGAANTLTFRHLRVATSGRYAVTIVYMAGEDRQAKWTLDGRRMGVVKFPATGGFSGAYLDSTQITIELSAGEHELAFSNARDYAPDFDRIVIRKVDD